MKTTTITTRNGKPSTIGNISEHADGTYWASIVNVSLNRESDIVLQAKTYSTLKGAEKFINAEIINKREAFEHGELVDGVVVL